MMIVRHPPPWLSPGHLQRRDEATMPDKVGRVAWEDQELTTSEDSRAVLLQGLCSKFVS